MKRLLISIILSMMLPGISLAQKANTNAPMWYSNLAHRAIIGAGPSMSWAWQTSFMAGTDLLQKPNPAPVGTGPLGSTIYDRQSVSNMGRGRRAATLPKGVQVTGTPTYNGSGSRNVRVSDAVTGTGTEMVIPQYSNQGAALTGMIRTMTPASELRESSPFDNMPQVMAEQKKELDENPNRPITSLVPTTPGRYRNAMSRAEGVFKKGDYKNALDIYTNTRKYSLGAAAPILGEFQASFALANNDYSKPAKYLAEIMTLVPELPSIRLHHESLYGNTDDFKNQLKKLQTFCKANPNNADAHFILGYFFWQLQQPEDAEVAMRKAYDATQNNTIKRAIEIFAQHAQKKPKEVAGPRPKLQSPIQLATAGITLAVPEGFQEEIPHLARCVLKTHDIKKDYQFMLSVFEVDSSAQPATFLNETVGQIKTSAGLENLRRVEQAWVGINGIVGQGEILDHTFGKKKRSAILFCVIRKYRPTGVSEDIPAQHLAYVFVIEGPEGSQAKLLQSSDAIADSVKWLDLKRPVDLSIKPFKTITDPRMGLSIEVPRGWSARRSNDGILLGQNDFAIGGVVCPAAHLVYMDIAANLTNESSVERILKREREKGYTVKLISKGPKSFLGQDGYEVVLSKQATGKIQDGNLDKKANAKAFLKPGPPFLEIVRFALKPSADRRSQSAIALTTVFVQTSEKTAQKITDTLAKTAKEIPMETSVETPNVLKPKEGDPEID